MQNLKNSEKKQNGPILNRMAWMMAPGKLELIESPLPELAVDEVLVKIKASAICGSDLHLFNGKHPSVKLPTAVGHECAGVVVELGAYARGFQLGDKVTIEPNINCGYCEACLHGDYGYCENINFTYRIGRGALADYIAVRQDKVFKLPESMPFAEGALIEPLAVATHAVRRAEIQMGEEVLVIGAGAIGIFVAALCKLHGAGSVVISDRSTERLETALRLGATGKLSSKDLDDHLNQAKSKRFDKVFECVGVEQTLGQAMRAAKRNGLITVLGIFEQGEATIPATLFASHEIRMQGSQGYCWDFPVAIQMAEKLDLAAMVTHKFPLSEVQKAFDFAIDRDSYKMKVVLEP
jgi:2-desacetyl-2-hydroxyethyl bacteriochlorophyllide A dehydrogenase